MMLAGGCAAGESKQQATDSPPTIDRVLEATLTPVSRVDPAAMLSRGDKSGVFLRSEPAGGAREVSYRAAQADGGEWVVTLEGQSRAVYRLDDAGNLRVVREEDPRQDAAAVYSPGLIVLPGEAVSARGEASVVIESLSGHRRDGGEVTYEVEVLGRTAVAGPGGVADAVVVRMTRTMDLRLADVRVESVRAWAEGGGIVAETVDRRVRALGFLSSRVRFMLERLTAE